VTTKPKLRRGSVHLSVPARIAGCSRPPDWLDRPPTVTSRLSHQSEQVSRVAIRAEWVVLPPVVCASSLSCMRSSEACLARNARSAAPSFFGSIGEQQPRDGRRGCSEGGSGELTGADRHGRQRPLALPNEWTSRRALGDPNQQGWRWSPISADAQESLSCRREQLPSWRGGSWDHPEGCTGHHYWRAPPRVCELFRAFVAVWLLTSWVSSYCGAEPSCVRSGECLSSSRWWWGSAVAWH
jgi:hypothetical protein